MHAPSLVARWSSALSPSRLKVAVFCEFLIWEAVPCVGFEKRTSLRAVCKKWIRRFEMEPGFFGKRYPSLVFGVVCGTYPMLLIVFGFVVVLYYWLSQP